MRASTERSMRQMSMSSRIRQRSRGGTTASAGFGAADITAIQEPQQIEVGETRAFHYDVQAQAASSPDDADWCVSSGIGDGYDLVVSARTDGDLVNADDICLQAGFTRKPHRFTFELTGRTEGTVRVRVAVHGSNSGSLVAEREFDLVVGDGGGGDNGGSVDPSDPPDGNGDGGGGGALLPCFVDPNRSCQTPEALAWTAVGTAGAIAVIGIAAD